MKVKATGEFKRLRVYPVELGCIPEAGTEFEVTEERNKVLRGNNAYKAVFVEDIVEVAKPVEEPVEVETAKKEVKAEKAVKTTKKTTKKVK